MKSDPAPAGRLFQILLVEDNPADARLTREALEASAIRFRLHRVEDGAKASEFLQRQGKHTAAPRPDLILLDLNIPRKNGHEVLALIKNDPDLKSIPVVVLTSSRADDDIRKAYDLHANCYVAKPFELERYLEVLRSTAEFWARTVQLPPPTT